MPASSTKADRLAAEPAAASYLGKQALQRAFMAEQVAPPAIEPAGEVRGGAVETARIEQATVEVIDDAPGAADEGGADEGDGEDGLPFHRKSRHVFVLSSAGKPIYARHGEEDRLATLMPMISAIYDQFDDQGDPIQCIIAGRHRFVFQKREPLYLLAISDQRDPEGLLIQQLQYVYQCVVSLVTDSRLAALKRNLRMDISSHLEPHVITELFDSMERNPCFLLGGWNCLPMDLEVRKAVTKCVKDSRVPEAIYALMIALPTTSRQVVTLLEPRKSPLDPTGASRRATNASAGQPRVAPARRARCPCDPSCFPPHPEV